MSKAPTPRELRVLLGCLKDEADSICPSQYRTVEFRDWCREATEMCKAFDRARATRNRKRRKHA